MRNLKVWDLTFLGGSYNEKALKMDWNMLFSGVNFIVKNGLNGETVINAKAGREDQVKERMDTA